MATQAISRPFTNNAYSTVQMAAVTETPQRPPMLADCSDDHPSSRIIPIPTPKIQMTAPSPGEPMDISSPTKPFAKMASSANNSPTSSAPTANNGNGNTSPNTNGSPTSRNEAIATANGAAPTSTPTPNEKKPSSTTEQAAAANASSMPAPPAAAAAAVHQPKIVQTAFIHKLYNMLEDQSIQHLISWSPSAESFVMSPTADFSKVLAQYFKHTNISSFVRQLNMYGFHKVSDVFHTGNPETALWEFKHGNGNFKRGDLVGLREIKRRASKHALVHREFNSQKPSPLQPGTPAEPMPMAPDANDPRLLGMEHTLYEMNMRLHRSEDHAHYMHMKQQAVTEVLGKVMQLNQELSRALLALVPSPDHPVHRDVVTLQGEFQRQSEMLRTIDEPHEQFANSRQYFSNIENPPVSPRQLAQDDSRRSTLAVPQPSRNNNFYRPPVPSNLSVTPRRPFGSFGASTAQTSPSSLRAPPPPPPGPHPLSHVEPPPSHLTRRHTSADIRAHGWQGQPNHNPYPAGAGGPPPPPSGQWPPSPNRVAPEDQRIRDSFSNYSLQAASQPRPHSRPTTPPPPFANGTPGPDSFGGWSFASGSSRENKNLAVRDSSGPPTRRSSMAHILNPADTAERDGEDEDPRGDDDRKRKRMQ
ncbi:hypothetical protein jhhlp_002159 [Lomentospora prolificans]|uniref:HSF-type DNA-binding domain-containing protein n=1 Tax=Lomentospora prolificans TaxID=41688 RepID=A0A2N3NDB1_9PEZI|nr:hypothetical protein jhhlp_002159 [Lomentospora prolificans]